MHSHLNVLAVVESIPGEVRVHESGEFQAQVQTIALVPNVVFRPPPVNTKEPDQAGRS